MANIVDGRMAAEMDGEFVVFLIGMRINKAWKVHKWLPVILAMPRMLKELHDDPESGFLGHVMSMRMPVAMVHSRPSEILPGLTALGHK